MAKAQWRNKRAILRDLAKVTQGDVLVNINEAITDDRPPALNISEDTEEEYLRFCSGERSTGTYTEGPDLHMIRDMISMMQSLECKSNEEEANNTALEITKITPHSSTPLLASASSSSPGENRISQSKAEELTTELTMKIQCQPKTVKAKRERNVAIASLLKVHANVAPIGYDASTDTILQKSGTSSPVKLLKPEDFTVTIQQPQTAKNKGFNVMAAPFKPKQTPLSENVGSVDAASLQPHDLGRGDGVTAALLKPQASLEKVNTALSPLNSMDKVDRWLKRGSQSPMKGPMLSADAFRFKKSQRVSPKPVVKPAVRRASPSRQYVPSPYANEIYRSILQQKEDHDAAQRLKEDIWQRAKRQMQALEAKRQQAACDEEIAAVVEAIREEDSGLQPVTVTLGNGRETQVPAMLCLPQHRHRLTGTCIVCASCESFASSKTPREEIDSEVDTDSILNTAVHEDGRSQTTDNFDKVRSLRETETQDIHTKNVISNKTKKAISDWICTGNTKRMRDEKPEKSTTKDKVVSDWRSVKENGPMHDDNGLLDAAPAIPKHDVISDCQFRYKDYIKEKANDLLTNDVMGKDLWSIKSSNPKVLVISDCSSESRNGTTDEGNDLLKIDLIENGKDSLGEASTVQKVKVVSDWRCDQISRDALVDEPTSKKAKIAAGKQDIALKLTGTSVPDFWEDLLLESPEETEKLS